MTAVCFGFHALPAMAKDTQIRCEMTNVSQGKRIVAPLNQHPWNLDFYLNDRQNSVRVRGPLTQTISENPIVAVVTSQPGGKIKFHWSIPGLRSKRRRMSGSYKFQASLDLTLDKVFIRVGDDRPHGTAPAFVTGKCKRI